MANGIRTGDPHGFNKGRSLKFYEGFQVQQTPEEGRRTYRPKCCENNNKDEDITLKTLNDKNHQVLSQKFEELMFGHFMQHLNFLTGYAILVALCQTMQNLVNIHSIGMYYFMIWLFLWHVKNTGQFEPICMCNNELNIQKDWKIQIWFILGIWIEQT